MSIPFPGFDALPMGAHRLIVSTDQALYDATGIRIAFTSRAGGVSAGCFESLNCASHVGDDPACIQRNRQLLLEALGARNARLIVPNQIHGTHIVEVGGQTSVPEASQYASEGADALAVYCDEVAALLNFADCLPLILASSTGAFAVVHAGWRGAVAGIAGKAARLLQERGADPCEINAYIGPYIHAECFEVGPDVARRFAETFGPSASPDSRHVDLADAVRCDLVRSGLDERRIIDIGICTKCHSHEYFSYRAEDGHCGRHAAVAVKLSS